MESVKRESEATAEYKAFKDLLARVLAVPHRRIIEREEEYQRSATVMPNRRGPKRKPPPSDQTLR
jgi:hypothetical protein